MDGWTMISRDDYPYIEIFPVNDSKPHTGGGLCPCNPRIEIVEDTDGIIISHISFDGREAVEMAYRIINP